MILTLNAVPILNTRGPKSHVIREHVKFWV